MAGMLQSSAQNSDWVTHIPNIDNLAVLSKIHDIETDAYENVYIAGTFNGTVDFGAGPVTAVGPIPGFTVPDGFIAKHDAGGALIWVETFPGGNGATVNDIALDEENNIYLILTTEGEVTIAGTLVGSPSDHGVAIAKLDESLGLVWLQAYIQATTNDLVFGHSIALGAADDLFVSGAFENDLTLGGLTLDEGGDDTRCFVARLDRDDGTVRWLNAAGNFFPVNPGSDVAADAEDNAYFTSSTIELSVYGGISIDAIDQRTFVLVKYDSVGAVEWIRRSFGQTNLGDRGEAVAVDQASGDVYVTGTFASDVFQLEGTTLSAADFCCDDFFIARYNSDGELQWARQSHGPAPSTRGLDIALAEDGAVMVIGTYGAPNDGGSQFLDVNFGEGNNAVFLENDGAWDVFIARYNADGTLDWAKRGYGTEADYVTCLALANPNSAVIGGTFNESFTIAGTTIQAEPVPASDNMYLARCSGTAVAVDEQENEMGIAISPNPLETYLNIELTGEIPAGCSAKIFDVSGRKRMSIENLEMSMKVDVGDLPAGTYFLQLKSESFTKSVPFAVVR